MKRCSEDYFCSFIEEFDRVLTRLRLFHSRSWLGGVYLINSNTICKHLESLEDGME